MSLINNFKFVHKTFKKSMIDKDLSLSNVQLNNSSSKMKYSFPKSQRFDDKQYNTPSPNKFYDLPDIKMKRHTGLGYGNKMDIGKQTVKTPAPNAYKLMSSFQLKKNEGISMYEGRDKIRANSVFNIKKQMAGQDYNPEKLKKSFSYSIGRSQKIDLSDQWIKKIPGPGTYSHMQLTNKETKVPISKYISAPSTRFGNMERKSEAEMKNGNTPAPAEYNNETLVSKKFYFRNGNQFPQGQRSSLIAQTKTPGPGAYNRASDFN